MQPYKFDVECECDPYYIQSDAATAIRTANLLVRTIRHSAERDSPGVPDEVEELVELAEGRLYLSEELLVGPVVRQRDPPQLSLHPPVLSGQLQRPVLRRQSRRRLLG